MILSKSMYICHRELWWRALKRFRSTAVTVRSTWRSWACNTSPGNDTFSFIPPIKLVKVHSLSLVLCTCSCLQSSVPLESWRSSQSWTLTPRHPPTCMNEPHPSSEYLYSSAHIDIISFTEQKRRRKSWSGVKFPLICLGSRPQIVRCLQHLPEEDDPSPD